MSHNAGSSLNLFLGTVQGMTPPTTTSSADSSGTPPSNHQTMPSDLELAAEAAIGRQRLPIHNLLALARAVNATNALGRTRHRRRDSAIPLPLADSSNVDQLVYQSRVVMSDQPYDSLTSDKVSVASVLASLSGTSGPVSAPPLTLKLQQQAKNKWKQAGNKAGLTPKIITSRGSVSAGSATGGPGSATTRRPSKAMLQLPSDLGHSASYDLDPEPVMNLEARISCAKSLYKLSCHEGNEMAMIQGNAIAQIADFSDVDHVKLQQVCAAIVANLTTSQDCLDAFVAHDGISALLELSWSQCIEVKLHCATALCRLSLHRSYAVILAKAKAIIELSSMLAIGNEELQRICVSCIMNMLFYGQSFTERIFTGDAHAVQNRLGVMNVVSQLAGMSASMRFATDVLFNLSLYRVSAIAALRTSASEILHMITTHVCKVGLYPVTSTANNSTNLRSSPQRIDPKTHMANQAAMFRLISDSLANYSSYSEYVSSMSSYCVKTLTLLLHALRDKPMDTRNAPVVEDAVRIVGGSCARVFANFSALEDLRKTVFHEETVLLVSKLLLLSPRHFTNPRAFFKNAIRTVANFGFHETCTSYFMHSTALLELLHAAATRAVMGAGTSGNGEDPTVVDNEDHKQMLLVTDDEVVEDALVTILNLAASGNYSTELLACLDGKLLAKAADQQPNIRLKYTYCVVLCNLVFDVRLRPLVAGDWAVNALVSGFFSRECGSDDDKESFLAALFYIANTIEQPDNIKQLVQVVSSCLQTPMLSNGNANRQRNSKNQATQASNSPPSQSLEKDLDNKPTVNPSFEYFGAAILYSIASSESHDSRQKQVELLLDPSNGDIENTLVDLSSRSSTNSATRAFCAATLYHICAAGHASTRILQALVEICNLTENVHMLLACAASFANVSFTSEGRQLLLKRQYIARALTKLGRTSDVECQQYASIAACNVSTCSCIWSMDELKDFVVVALLRANSSQAKQVHARTLYNLLSHSTSRAKLVDDGVLYALMKLAHIQSAAETKEMDDIMRLGYQALYNLSCDRSFHTKLLQNGVVQHLLTCIHGKPRSTKDGQSSPHRFTTLSGSSDDESHEQEHHGRASHSFETGRSPRSSILEQPSTHNAAVSPADVSFRLSLLNRRLGVGILANLSACEENHKELMEAQLPDVLHKYCDHDVETRACVAIALRNLSCHQPWVELLSNRKTLTLLLVLAGSSSKLVQRFAIETLANCSLVTDAMHLFNELQVVRVLLALLEDDQPETETCLAGLKLLHNLAFDDTLAADLIDHHAIERVRPLSKVPTHGEVSQEASLIASRMTNLLAGKPKCIRYLVTQDIVGFCGEMYDRYPHNVDIAYESVCTLMRMSTFQHIQLDFTETSAIALIVHICESLGGENTSTQVLAIRECGAITLRNLTLCVTEHFSEFYDEDEEETMALRGVKGTEHLDLRKDSTVDNELGNFASEKTLHNLLFGVAYLQQEIKTLTTLIKPGSASATGRTATSAGASVGIPSEVIGRILEEASAAITNLSTVRSLRLGMVQNNILGTFLQLCSCGIESVQEICASTLHRFSLDDQTALDQSEEKQQLVPSLLGILKQSDDALHCVRYECEKVSVVTNRLVPIKALVGATKCYRPSFKEPKWALHAIEATLSSRNMVPEIETKPLKRIGTPKPSACNAALFQRHDPRVTMTATQAGNATTEVASGATNAPNRQQDANSYLHGFLLPVDSAKRQVKNVDKLDDAKSSSSHDRLESQQQDADSVLHHKKFERHMRIARRNYRHNPSLLPVLTML